MSSEIIVILTLVALAVIGLVYLELHSRRNRQREDQNPQAPDRE
jgi:positive regulator of sigma E activity